MQTRPAPPPTPAGCRALWLWALFVAAGGSLPAATWDGGGSGTPWYWDHAANWNPDGVPSWSSSLDVYFNNNTGTTTHMGDNRTVRSIIFESGAGAFSIDSNSGNEIRLHSMIRNQSSSTQIIKVGVGMQADWNLIWAEGGNIELQASTNGNWLPDSRSMTLRADAGRTITSHVWQGWNSGDIVKDGKGTVVMTNTRGVASGDIAPKTVRIIDGTYEVSNLAHLNQGQAVYLGGNSSASGTGETGTLRYTGNSANFSRNLELTSDGTGGIIEVTTSGQTLTFTSGNSITTNNKTLTIQGAGNTTLEAVVSGSGGLTKAGSGTLNMSAAHSYTGNTRIEGGTLLLTAANRISDSSNMVLAGGTFSTGSSSGYGETVGRLTLTENSTINLGTGSHTLTFAASDSETWTSGKLLTITGWSGTEGNSGTAGRIFFGSASTNLTSSQLAQIQFSGFGTGATLLGTGELVPFSTPIPEPSLWIGCLTLASLGFMAMRRNRGLKNSIESR